MSKVPSSSGSDQDSASKTVLLRQLAWRSRRGVLELDLILVPFVQQVLEHLPHDQIALYRILLESEDPDLVQWLQYGNRQGLPEHLTPIVERIRATRTC
ncbi:MAG: succinate dehydrogenase assembly factor 2 [Gammaproteobacteria bacterium]